MYNFLILYYYIFKKIFSNIFKKTLYYVTIYNFLILYYYTFIKYSTIYLLNIYIYFLRSPPLLRQANKWVSKQKIKYIKINDVSSCFRLTEKKNVDYKIPKNLHEQPAITRDRREVRALFVIFSFLLEKMPDPEPLPRAESSRSIDRRSVPVVTRCVDMRRWQSVDRNGRSRVTRSLVHLQPQCDIVPARECDSRNANGRRESEKYKTSLSRQTSVRRRAKRDADVVCVSFFVCFSIKTGRQVYWIVTVRSFSRSVYIFSV